MEVFKRMIRALGIFGYYAIGYRLPRTSLPIVGSVSKRVRTFFVRMFFTRTGKNVNIDSGCYVGKGRIEIGDNSGIGRDCEVHGTVHIGKNVLIAPEVLFYCRNHLFSDPNVPIIGQGYSQEAPIHIEDDVWIGRRAVLLPGVTVSKGSVVGACCLVTKDVPPYTIVGGVPSKVIGKRS